MKIEARFRRRAVLGENVEDLNARVLHELSTIEGLWIKEQGISGAHLDSGQGESAAVDISPCLGNGMKGAISYASRLSTFISDKAINDDTLVIQMDADAVDFVSFCRCVFPAIVRVFCPYRANIVTDLNQDLDDFEEIVEEVQRTGRDVDGRDTVFRIYPTNYFDDVMCRRAFGLSADEVVVKLSGKIMLAEYFQLGALLILIDKPVADGALIALDVQIRNILKL